MLRKLVVLAVIIGVMMTFRSESAFDLNSGKMRVKFSLLGLTFYDQVKETPLSRLNAQFFPGSNEEPNWYPLGGKSVADKEAQPFPMDAVLQVASVLKSDAIAPEQKKEILARVWDSIKNQNYEAIGQLQRQLDLKSQAR
ncbi:MAG TPA: hypothetical protein VEC37_14895 [Bacillota bacterium]|nr:hypothetical protein [Bacillota bacterium]